jgi:transcriptional regulator with XRE-family HTH domain
MALEVQSFSSVVGRELRILREAGGIRQDQLAAEARRLGLTWTKATVAAIELGRRQLSLGEFWLLPLILGRVGAGWGYDHSDLIPDDDRPVLVAGGTVAPARVVRAGFAAPSSANTAAEIKTPSPPKSSAPPVSFTLPRAWFLEMLKSLKLGNDWYATSTWQGIALEAAGDAEHKAATSLGVPPLALSLAARRVWGRSLTAERDRKVVNATAPALARDPDATADPEWPRRLQAIRGHVTRELLAELRLLLKGAVTRKKKRRTR